jgi:hypothetical protein
MMSAIATPAISDPFGSTSGWTELWRRLRRQPPFRAPQPGQNGSRLWLIAIAVWLAVLGGQMALSGSATSVCHGTTEALRQLLSFHV